MMSLKRQKEELIEYWKEKGIIKDKNILKAFRDVRREDFVLPQYKHLAYVDSPLPILKGQTISQPTTVAIMTQLLEPKKGHKVLEIGTGSGYQAAILSKVVGREGKVYTIERIPELYEYARQRLKRFRNVKVYLGDGSKGLEEAAPFDRIIVTAGAKTIPKPLVKQLKVNGRMVIPVGYPDQKMLVIKKKRSGLEIEDHGYFVFVPLVSSNE